MTESARSDGQPSASDGRLLIAARQFYVDQRVTEFTTGWDERNGHWASDETRAQARCQCADWATKEWISLMDREALRAA